MAKGKPPFLAAYDDRVRAFFTERRIFLRWPCGVDGVYEPGDEISIHRDVVVEPDATMPPGLFRCIGGFSVCLTSDVPEAFSVGRHSFLAADVRVMGINHPTDWVTTHPLAFRGYGPGLARTEFGKVFRVAPFGGVTAKVSVGHGVSVESGVLLRRGVRIGNGAIVRAGAIVTRDVQPYEVVSGAPARSEGLRFGSDVVRRLVRSAWWDFTPMDLAQLPVDDARAFLNGLKQRLRSGVVSRKPASPIRLAAALKDHLAQSGAPVQ